jgi:hypothetical protein
VVDLFLQAGIALSGIVAIWLVQEPQSRWYRWGCLIGFLGQPLWFLTAWMNEQWGIFILCFFYAFAWYRGVHKHFIKPIFKEKKKILKS